MGSSACDAQQTRQLRSGSLRWPAAAARVTGSCVQRYVAGCRQLRGYYSVNGTPPPTQAGAPPVPREPEAGGGVGRSRAVVGGLQELGDVGLQSHGVGDKPPVYLSLVAQRLHAAQAGRQHGVGLGVGRAVCGCAWWRAGQMHDVGGRAPHGRSSLVDCCTYRCSCDEPTRQSARPKPSTHSTQGHSSARAGQSPCPLTAR